MNRKHISTALILMTLLSSCSFLPQSGDTEETVPPITVTTRQAGTDDNTQSGGLYYSPVAYSKKGTGPAKPDGAPAEDYYSTYVATEDGTNHITNLKDTAIQDKINLWIDEACGRADQKYAEFLKLSEGDSRYTTSEYDTPYYASASCINGYLFIDVVTNCHMIDESIPDLDYIVPYYADTSAWDLYTGEKLEFTDLFYEGIDFISHYNKCIENEIQLPQNMTGFSTMIVPMKREFAGITEDAVLSINMVCFPKNNPYFQTGMNYYVSTSDLFFRDNSIIGQKRETESLFADTEYMYISAESWIHESDMIQFSSEKTVKNIIVYEIKSCDFLNDNKIRQINDLANKTVESDEMIKLAQKLFNADFDKPMYSDEWFGGYLFNITINRTAGIIELSLSPYMDELSAAVYYDLNTLERLSNAEIFERVFGDDLIYVTSYDENGIELTDEFISDAIITKVYISETNTYRSIDIAHKSEEEDFYYPIALAVDEDAKQG